MRIAAAIATLLLAAGAASAQVQPGPTLSAVRAKGVLDCGGHPGAPGFGSTDSQGIYRGLEADTCRALAAAVLGDPAKVRFTVLTSQARLPALQSGQIDVLPRTTTWTQTRDTANGLNFTVVTFFDGQGFLVKTASGVNRAKALENATICVTSGTTNELNLTDWGRTTGVRFQPVVFEQPTETVQAYEKGRCDALSTDASQLIGIRTG
jgi:general L-amino acid transport system substrate-binding protein